MAGVKVTDLPTATSATSTDVMYIVDTGSNTSKQIEVGDMFSSGSWTPTFSTFIDAIIDVTQAAGIYSRVGNIVTCSIALTIEVDFSGFNTGSVQFTLPFATTTGGASGSLSSSNTSKQFNGAVRPASTTLGRITMGSEDTSFVTSSVSCHAIFQYEVN